MNKEIKGYNTKQSSDDKEISDKLATIIDNELTESESKIWHAHPVWFLDGNPIVGYSKQKAAMRLKRQRKLIPNFGRIFLPTENFYRIK